MPHGTFIFQKPTDGWDEDPDLLNEYLMRMFKDIAANFEMIYDGRTIERRHVEPTHRRDGMIAYADGTNWNPGAGAGFYGREEGAWVKL